MAPAQCENSSIPRRDGRPRATKGAGRRAARGTGSIGMSRRRPNATRSGAQASASHPGADRRTPNRIWATSIPATATAQPNRGVAAPTYGDGAAERGEQRENGRRGDQRQGLLGAFDEKTKTVDHGGTVRTLYGRVATFQPRNGGLARAEGTKRKPPVAGRLPLSRLDRKGRRVRSPPCRPCRPCLRHGCGPRTSSRAARRPSLRS